MDATCGAGTAHPQFLVGFIYLIFSFLFNVLNIIVCPFAIVLSVLQFMASDYPVCIFKLGMTWGEAETKAKDRTEWHNLVATLCSDRSKEDR